MRTGIANSPLHGGFCPPWLFEQMKRLSAAMVEVIVEEFSPEEVLVTTFRSGMVSSVWMRARFRLAFVGFNDRCQRSAQRRFEGSAS